ncbi:rhomboid family intramembrane serine protease [Paracoccus stylophorae]|uniref:Rhomboid family intramembrane serine protease n=1 Tax=Paracoccus stylophorae TaxID=659350 RepID=A0ABY7SWK1_9RHOB|nr:rhomboid family intramembrane serine protease [Paracoccus stylophorae]WCR11321.1 rhomboid family intramembrane serine protease [Paracoccus stylophorae]
MTDRLPRVGRTPRAAAVPRQVPLWVTVLILACCAIEAALLLAGMAGYPAARQVAFMLGGFWSPLIHDGYGLYPGQPLLMFLTYGLLHSGPMHLAMNMISLAFVARELSRLLGAGTMAAIYLAGQIGAAALFAVMQPAAGPMIGASGAVFGIAGALVGYAAIVGHRRRRRMGQMWRSVGLIVALNVGITVLVPSIAWQAHLGGAAVGAILGIALALRGAPGR